MKSNELLTLHFWQRVKNFVENTQVNDLPSEEEKNAILYVCDKVITEKTIEP